MPRNDTQFKKGQSGNPRGRPKGALNKATLAVQALFDDEAKNISLKAVELALKGDTVALRLCLERICPPRRERTVLLDIPATDTPKGMVEAMSRIIAAVASGVIAPGEGTALAALIENQRRTIEIEELERRINQLEERAGR